MTTTTADHLDEEVLRVDRRRRLFSAMADHGLDALVLGRPAEITFATGARQLWTAGSRPFGPACVAVAATGHTHLLSVSDYDVPEEVGHNDLYGLSWNPANLAASLAAIGGLATAGRIGTTSSSPGFGRLLAAVAPGCEIVDGATAMWAARLPKSAAEVDRIASATALAAAAAVEVRAALVPGANERALLAAYLGALADLGVPTPTGEGVACATPTVGPVTLRRVLGDGPIGADQLVVIDVGAFDHGYEGGIGRTWPAGGERSAAQHALTERCRTALDAVIGACRPGARGADLLDAWTATGEALPVAPIAHGIGLGAEPPVIGAGVGGKAVLVAGTVLAVTGWVAEEGTGGVLQRDLVLVDDLGPRMIAAGDVP